ncbi:MAG TPA: response regulator [Verrucomicrobiae bacterium]|nr:response regulator [Verrucomicrobiae bacterium]
MKTRFKETRKRANEFWVDGFYRFHSLQTASRTILLVSNDTVLHENLRSVANEAGLMVVKADPAAGTVEVLQVVRPSAVLLDLDLPDEAAWKTADTLLNEPDCPAVILVTGRTGHFAMEGAIRAGLLVGKGDSPGRLLQIIEAAMEMPRPGQAQRNVLRRELIRWVKPPTLELDSGSAYRFWGINE